MSKINIIHSDNEILESYANLTTEQVDGIINGTCDEIICTILDKLDFNTRIKLIHSIIKKLSNQGFVTFKFYNATKLCKDLIKGNINSNFLSKIIAENQSLCIESDMIEVLTQINNIGIQKIYNDNQYIIMVLQKRI